jgi:beta-glucosidase
LITGLGDLPTVSARALNAGIEMDMVGEGFLTTLKQSLQDGKVTLARIDAACRLVLEAKYRLGLFEDPYRYCDSNRAKNEVFTGCPSQDSKRDSGPEFCFIEE